MAKRVLRYRRAMGLPFLRMGLAASALVFALVISLHDAWCWSQYQRWLDRLEPCQAQLRELVGRRDDILRRHRVELLAAKRARAEVAAQSHAETARLIDLAARQVGERRRSALQRQLAVTLNTLASVRQRERDLLDEGERLQPPFFWGRQAFRERPGPVLFEPLPSGGPRAGDH